MDAAQWIAAFRETHEKAKRGGLNEGEQKRYLGMREELARSLVNSEGLSIPDGKTARDVFRVAYVFPIELSGLYKTMTQSISCQGFTALVGGTFKEGDEVPFALKLPGNPDPLQGLSRAVAVPRQAGGSTRLSCTFIPMDPERRERLEVALFDAALSRIK